MERLKKSLKLALVFAALTIACIFRPARTTTPQLVHPEIRTLETPLKTVIANSYPENSSHSIFIRDANGRTLLASTSPATSPGSPATLFLGSLQMAAPKAKKVTSFPDSQQALHALITAYNPHHIEIDSAKSQLSGRLADQLINTTRRLLNGPSTIYRKPSDHSSTTSAPTPDFSR